MYEGPTVEVVSVLYDEPHGQPLGSDLVEERDYGSRRPNKANDLERTIEAIHNQRLISDTPCPPSLPKASPFVVLDELPVSLLLPAAVTPITATPSLQC